MIRLIKRRIHTSRQLWNIKSLGYVDNAPKQADNEEWLQKLEDHSKDKPDAIDKYNCELQPSYKLTKLEPNESLQGKKASLGGLNYHVVNINAKDEELVDVQMSLKDYFMGTEYSQSIFARFKGGSSRVAQARRIEQKTFVDLRIITLGSGNGGSGCVSFGRDAHKPVGPPDGGDGGDGGDVYVRVVEGSSLHKLRKTYKASPGTNGASAQLDGKRGQDVVIDIPVGTTIRWIPDTMDIKTILQQVDGDMDRTKLELQLTSEFEDELQLFRPGYIPGEGWIFRDRDDEYFEDREYFNKLNDHVKVYDKELIEEERLIDRIPILGWDFNKADPKPFLLLKGGKGGMGNMHFLTNDVRNPRFAKKGRNGINGTFLFELKLIADLGLVGLPNAGKSSLLRAISRARPRVGHWEFTTLQPTIGTIFTTIDEDPFTVADIPGIIKGAKDNKGMGLDFLRHIERSGGLVFVVSLEGDDPIADLQILKGELGLEMVKDKKVLVVATKADLTTNGTKYHLLKKHVEQAQWKIIPVCSPRGENIEQCIRLMSETAKKE